MSRPPDALGQWRQAGEGRPRIERVGVRADDRRVVVGAEQPLEPVLLGEPREPHPVVPGDAFLALDHETGPHRCSGSVAGALQTNRSQT